MLYSLPGIGRSLAIFGKQRRCPPRPLSAVVAGDRPEAYILPDGQMALTSPLPVPLLHLLPSLHNAQLRRVPSMEARVAGIY